MSAIRKWIILALIPIIVLGLCFLTLSEIGILDSLDSRWTCYNDSVNISNQIFAAKNEFGFTDKHRSRKRDKDEIRIAVLGDSFVYGDGLPFHQVWPHQLQQILNLEALNKDIEIITWGKCGWSTLDQYNFIVAHGQEFEIDLLLIGFVHNDPDLGNMPQFSDEDFVRAYRVKNLFPWISEWYVNRMECDNYISWLAKIYESENLKDYSKIIHKLDSVVKKLNWETRFILTPSVDSGEYERFAAIKNILDPLDIKYLDLEPVQNSKFSEDDMNEHLQSNPANGHPGSTLNALFASTIYDYLKNDSLLRIRH
jgi:hypothetical protein